jgi:multidrug efflux pump subunit AcrA (membrane-fusion protein)
LPLNYVQAAEPLGCIIEPERVSEVGSSVISVVESMSIECGDLVKKGQILATTRADVEVATTRSQAQVLEEKTALLDKLIDGKSNTFRFLIRITKSLSTNAQGAALQTFKIKPANKSASSQSSPIKTGNLKWETKLTQIKELKSN